MNEIEKILQDVDKMLNEYGIRTDYDHGGRNEYEYFLCPELNDETKDEQNFCNDDNECEVTEEAWDSDCGDWVPSLRNLQDFSVGSPVMVTEEEKTIKVYKIAERLAEFEHLCVFDQSELYHYEKSRGYYKKISFGGLGVLIDEYLSEEEKRSLTEYKRNEVWKKLVTTSALQVNDEWNSQPQKINCENGVLCIDGEECFHLKPHDPEEKFNYCINASYNASYIECPTFDKFCNTSLEGSAEKRQLLLETMGYIISDFYLAKKAFFLKGAPDSGKSVILAFLEKLIGPEMVSNISIHQLNDRFSKAELYGKKVNIQAEMKADDLKDISTFKAITGQDKISGEYKGKSPFFFTPRCKLIFAGNAMPSSAEPEATKALLNRLIILLFNKSIPKEGQDSSLPERLWEERNSIFTLAIQAYSRLKKNNFEFTQPEESRRYIEYYGTLENNIKLFLEDECTVNPELVVRVAVLYDKYQEYCRLNGFETKKLGEFSKFMLETSDFQRKRINKGSGNNFWYYVGIGLKEDIACQE